MAPATAPRSHSPPSRARCWPGWPAGTGMSATAAPAPATSAAAMPGVLEGADARPPHPPAGQPGDGPEVAFARSGLTVRWGRGYDSLLELAEACDVPVRWSCRTGVCHSCETNLMSGAVRYAPEPVDEPADGSTLICCSQPAGDLVLDL